VPDAVVVYQQLTRTIPQGRLALSRQGEAWTCGQIRVSSVPSEHGVRFTVHAPGTPLVLVHARWQQAVSSTGSLRILGDAWERSYGDLGWRNLIPERVMPWYFATTDGNGLCHGYGVKTDTAALCFWQVDTEGVSLWMNVANGGEGVLLGDRELALATTTSRRGVSGESSFDAVKALCRSLCARPTRDPGPIYGANDYCYSYQTSTAASILRDTEFIAGLSPTGSVRPFSVIDEGYFDGTAAWPSMADLAKQMKQSGARPGIWVRPLRVAKNTAAALLLPATRFADGESEPAYDPTVPEAQEAIRAKLRQLVEWGYEMLKHDFSTYDMLGQWGSAMGPHPTLPGWSLHDRSITNAEMITNLNQLIRASVGEQVVIDGCNTMGPLGQGIFDMQRTGDDTSGRHWERTRRMGVNTLAMRLPQHGTFHMLDADLVGITDAVPWELNRQFLFAIARSGTATIVSPGLPAHGAEQQAALREALAIAAAGGEGARPTDWMELSAPEHWQGRDGREQRYRWSGPDETSAFLAS